MSQELARLNRDVTLVVNTGSELGRRATASGLKVFPVRMRQDYDLIAAWKLRDLIRKHRFDIIHAHHPTAHAISLLAAKLSGVPGLVVTRRVIFKIKNNPFSRWKYTSLRINRYVAVCREIKSILEDYGVNHNRVKVIPSAVDLESFRPVQDKSEARKKWGLNPDDVVVGTVGNSAWFKGHSYLMQAAQTVMQMHPNAKLFFCGKGTEDLIQKARELGIERNVILSGFRTDIPDILTCLDIFVLPSLREGIATAGIEGMAAGLPVIGTKVGGIPDIVSEETGLLVPPADSRALAEAIMRLIGDSKLKIQMGAAGRLKAQREFAKEKVAQQILELYQDALTGTN